MLHLLVAAAHAAALDAGEVGGLWGTPGAEDATALWWNPASIAWGRGYRGMIEVAPTWGGFDYERADPGGGADTYRAAAPIPFGGLVTDLGVRGLGVGLALAVPYAVAAAEQDPPGPGAWSFESGTITAAHGILGLAWAPHRVLSVGATVAVAWGLWDATLLTDTLPYLHDGLLALGQESPYTDEDLEDLEYAAEVHYTALQDWSVTGSVGLSVQPHPAVRVGAAWIQGYRADHEGPATLAFGCPPQDDAIGRFAAESYGICDTVLAAEATVSYRYPSRLHGSVRVEPIDRLAVEAMGGVTSWSVYDEVTLTLSDMAARNPDLPPETVELLEGEQPLARGGHDTWWAALDVKGRPLDPLLLGARVTWDAGGIDDAALAPNNYDAAGLAVGTLAAWRVMDWLELGISFTRTFRVQRTITGSGYHQALDPADRAPPGWSLPQMNGVYTGFVNRLGLAVRTAL